MTDSLHDERTRERGAFSAVWNGIRRRRRDRLAVACLQALDDHLLRDIGVTRAGISQRVRGR